MSSRFTLSFIVAALLFGGITASFGRTLIEMPAWRQVGVKAWAEFSRAADLGNGKIVYPLEGIGGALLTLAAAIGFRLSPKRPRSVAIPIYGAVLMKVGVLLVTVKAAPIMMSVARIGNDPVALQQAFEGFDWWGNLRAVFVALGYCATVWSLVAILRTPGGFFVAHECGLLSDKADLKPRQIP
jgi:hypothetical protein